MERPEDNWIDPFTVPERATEKDLQVLIDLNKEIIATWKRWASAHGPNGYEQACAEMKRIRYLVGADRHKEKAEEKK